MSFEHDLEKDGRAIRLLPPEAADQVEVDNDRARWPCFFPSSVGMITSYGADGVANLMPCGSTTIVSRQPMVVGVCISYSKVNERYAPRKSLDLIRESGWFGCGVPFIEPTVLDAIRYTGNLSLAKDPDKAAHSGLEVVKGPHAPLLPALPIQMECQVIGEEQLGSHVLMLGEVRRGLVRTDLTPDRPLEWYGFADVRGPKTTLTSP